jgi:6-phosphogluconolactonase
MTAARRVFPTPEAAAEACARHIAGLIGRGRVSLALSGGSTPTLLFRALAAMRLSWEGVHLFWVDERCVPPDDPQSNYRLAEENLILPAGIPPEQVHRVFGELHPEQAAQRYAEEIREFFSLAPGALPRFDVVHMGMGPDAHTASLFPGSEWIEDRETIAAAVYAEKFHQWRVTLLPGTLSAARNAVFLAAGADKAEALRNVFHAPRDPRRYPAQLLADQAVWFLDAAAASGM